MTKINKTYYNKFWGGGQDLRKGEASLTVGRIANWSSPSEKQCGELRREMQTGILSSK